MSWEWLPHHHSHPVYHVKSITNLLVQPTTYNSTLTITITNLSQYLRKAEQQEKKKKKQPFVFKLH